MGQGYISCPIGRVVVRTYTGRREVHLGTSPELQPVTGGLDEVQHVAGAPGEAQREALAKCSPPRSTSRPDAPGEARRRSLLARPACNSPVEPRSPRELEARGRPAAGRVHSPGSPGAHRYQFLQGLLAGGKSAGIFPCKGSLDSEKVAGCSSICAPA